MKVEFELDSHGYHEKIGLATYLLARDRITSFRELRFIRDRLEPAIRHGQVAFGFNYFAKPVAFAAWAALTPDVELRVRRNSDAFLHESEWNEGDSAWILAGVLPAVAAPAFCREVRKRLLARYQRIVVPKLNGRVAEVLR